MEDQAPEEQSCTHNHSRKGNHVDVASTEVPFDGAPSAGTVTGLF